MDWTAAIDKNREALKRILAMLVAMAEMGAGGQFILFRQEGGPDVAGTGKSNPSPAFTLPRQLHRTILRLLRPAEAAARRLIIVAARGLVVVLPPRPRQPATPGQAGPAGMPPRNLAPPPLPLLDRLSPWRVRAARPARAGVPRISVPGYSQPFAVRMPSADDPLDAARLALRLQTLAAALDDLPGHAKRFARWRARTAGLRRPAVPPPLTPPHKGEGNPAAPLSSANGGGFFAAQQGPPPPCGEGLGVGVLRRRNSRLMSSAMAPDRPRRLWPLRPGHPPGWRRKPVHEVHEVLDVVHGLAHWVLEAPDTS